MKERKRLRMINNMQKKYNINFSINAEAFQAIEYFIDWKNVQCYEGYCIYNPNKTIGRISIKPIKIVSPNFTTSMNDIITKYHYQLPRIKWSIDRLFNIHLSNEEHFKNAIPNFAKELDILQNDKTVQIIKKNNLSVTINDIKYNYIEYKTLVEHKITEQKSRTLDSNIFSEDHILDWKYIIFLDGCYVILPIIKGLFIEPIAIRKKNSKKIYNSYIANNKELFSNIKININQDFKIENFLFESLNNCISKLSKIHHNQLIGNDNKHKNDKDNNPLLNKIFIMNWEDVSFGNKYYSFNPNHNKFLSNNIIEKLYIEDSRSRESFNFIIKYLMKRMPTIHFQITNNQTIKLLDKEKPSLEAAINFLVKEQAKYNIGVGEIAEATGHVLKAEKLTFDSAMSKAASMKPEDFRKYKSLFINYLISQQHKQYKVVPMSESITHSNLTFEEATFIFTMKSWNNSLLLIIENVNPDRSTIIFKVNTNKYKNALLTVFDFMQSNIVNKRSSIREKSLSFSECGIIEYWSCNHDSFNDWKERIEKHIEQ